MGANLRAKVRDYRAANPEANHTQALAAVHAAEGTGNPPTEHGGVNPSWRDARTLNIGSGVSTAQEARERCASTEFHLGVYTDGSTVTLGVGDFPVRVDGDSRSGVTTVLRGISEQGRAAGFMVFYAGASPAAANRDHRQNNLVAISSTHEDSALMVNAVRRILESRIERNAAEEAPILLVVDENGADLWDTKLGLYGSLRESVSRLLVAGADFRIFVACSGISAGQDKHVRTNVAMSRTPSSTRDHIRTLCVRTGTPTPALSATEAPKGPGYGVVARDSGDSHKVTQFKAYESTHLDAEPIKLYSRTWFDPCRDDGSMINPCGDKHEAVAAMAAPWVNLEDRNGAIESRADIDPYSPSYVLRTVVSPSPEHAAMDVELEL